MDNLTCTCAWATMATRYGQRIGNYSVEYRLQGSQQWDMLVPPVMQNDTTHSLGDRSVIRSVVQLSSIM